MASTAPSSHMARRAQGRPTPWRGVTGQATLAGVRLAVRLPCHRCAVVPQDELCHMAVFVDMVRCSLIVHDQQLSSADKHC